MTTVLRSTHILIDQERICLYITRIIISSLCHKDKEESDSGEEERDSDENERDTDKK